MSREVVMSDMPAIQRTLRTRLRKMDAAEVRAMGQECADNPGCAILIRRNFLRGLCGYWSQSLDTLMSIEIAKILK